MTAKPKYIQIEETILNNIQNHLLKPGERIPTEAELCETYQVSRMTVNKALQSLATQGYIRRIAGKGSFVTHTRMIKPLFRKPYGFSEEMEAKGLKPGTKLVSYQICRGSELPSEVAAELQVSPKDMIHHFSRIRTCDDIIICLSNTYVPCSILSAVDVSSLERSFFAHVKELGLNIQCQDLSLSAIIATEEQKSLLCVDDDALLKYICRSYLDTGDILEYTETCFIGSRYTFHTTI